MPAEFVKQVSQTASAWLWVAAGAVPVGLLAWGLAPRGEPLLPRWKPWRVPWNGFEVFAGFVLASFVIGPLAPQVLERAGFYRAVYGDGFPAPAATGVDPDVLTEANTLRQLWANAFALPVLLGLLWAALRSLHQQWPPAVVGRGTTAGKVRLAVLAWLTLLPVVMALNLVVNVTSEQFGEPPQAHPLTKLAGRPPVDRALLAVGACVEAPLREEVLIRGLLLAWCVGRIPIVGAGVRPPTGARPAIVMAIAASVAVTRGPPGAVFFAGLLMVGLAVLSRVVRSGARRARAVYATAGFFALMHPTWPNPIPLFVLGLGLGWLAVRTNGVLVPVLVHSLFNAVSTVLLLRGG